MFEQSILLPDADKKPWTFAASLMVEVAVVSVVLLIPLVYTETLGLGWIQSGALPVPPRPLPPKTLVHVEPTSHALPNRVPHPFPIPTVVPTYRATIIVDPVQAVCTNCVPDGVPSVMASDYRDIGIGGTRIAPPPPKQTTNLVEAAKKPPVEATQTSPVKVSLGAQEAKIIRRIIPPYPPLARQTRVQGTVKLLGVISTEGRIERLQVLSGHPLLIPAAVDAVSSGRTGRRYSMGNPSR